MSTSEYELLKIATFVLKVHMNCQGCMNRVRKALRKIEGVYKVEINAEQQKVTVTGSVNLSTLVQKLAKFGKHAEIWNWNADYSQEQVNLVKDDNKNQAEYIINGHNAYENQYPMSTFGRDIWELEWCLNKHKDATDVEREINQHSAEPLSLDNVNNINHQYFTRINENPTWEESMIPRMRPTSFQENNGPYYSHLGSQEWAWNLLGVSPIGEYGHQPSPPIGEYGHQPSPMANIDR